MMNALVAPRKDSAQPGLIRQDLQLEMQSMRNWYLLASITAISTVGLVVTRSPFIRQSIQAFWPWARTDLVLLVGLVGMTLILILHLTLQQLKVRQLRRDFRTMEKSAHERDRKSTARLHALLNVTRMMSAVSEPDSLLEGIADVCLDIFDCQQASLMVLDPQTQTLEVKAACGHRDPEKVMQVKQKVGVGIAGHEEVILQTFQCAQQFQILSAGIVLGGALKHAVLDGKLWALLKGIPQAWRNGRRAKFLSNVHYEALWATPLDDIRAQLNITPVGNAYPVQKRHPDAPWDAVARRAGPVAS